MARKRKYLQPKKKAYAVVVDGETEVWYFQMLKRNEPDLQVNIEPKIPQRKSLQDQYDKVISLVEDFTRVFWIIDLDVIIQETKKVRKCKKTQIQYLKECFDDLNTKYSNVITIVNNPCLEFWFLLHFEQTTKYFDKCSETENQLKKHLTDYQKTRKYFTKQNQDIYLKLKSNLRNAVSNAKRTGTINFEQLEKGLSEMNIFFETETIKAIIET
ncbi:MAG: RloB family protein [Promethearchaeota archaeon]